jgi:N-ethylmaleimide reductase
MGYPGTPGIHSSEQVAGWRQVTNAVHERGGQIFLQLWHVGRISHPVTQEGGQLPVAPSAIAAEGTIPTVEGMKPFVTPRALETEEIAGIVEDFRAGAQNALEAGFDGVEIHGANGYLPDQFLQDGTNKRDDRYGGSIENRARFLLEIVEAVVGVWGPGRVGVRISPCSQFNSMGDSNPAPLFSYVAERLNTFDLAYLHIVEPASKEGFKVNGVSVSPTAHLRSIYKGIIIANQGHSLESGNLVIANDTADMVAYGTLFLANPDLPERFAARAPLNKPDVSTFYGGGEKGYIDYPALELQTA